MATIHVNGRITEEGQLEVDLPAGVPAGEARITIELLPEKAWTGEELDRALHIEPLTGAEIIAAGLASGWEDLGIASGAEWAEEQRRLRRERRS